MKALLLKDYYTLGKSLRSLALAAPPMAMQSQPSAYRLSTTVRSE